MNGFAEAARLTRLSVGAGGEKEQALRDVAAGVAAPILVSYVLWILRRAKESGIERLYFLSRDGQILLETAKRLAPRVAPTIELRYLYASRQAWHAPSIQRLDREHFGWLFARSYRHTVRVILARVFLEPEEVADALAAVGFPAAEWDRELDPAKERVMESFLLSEPIREAVEENAGRRRELMVEYLRQEGLAGGTGWAVVDLGWHGRLQDSLAAVLRSCGGTIPRGFYFGLREDSNERAGGLKQGFYFDHRPGHGHGSEPNSLVTIMEMFCSADHGGVQGYRREDGRVVAELRSPRNGPVLKWGIRKVHESICRFAEVYAADAVLPGAEADVRPALGELLERFWYEPSTEEARAWGSFPYECEQAGGSHRRLAEAFEWGAVFRGGGNGHMHSWWPASILLTSPLLRQPLRLANTVRKVVRRGRRGV